MQKSMKMYEERLRDLDRERHDKKMQSADDQLTEHRRKLKSARQLYEEELRKP